MLQGIAELIYFCSQNPVMNGGLVQYNLNNLNDKRGTSGDFSLKLIFKIQTKIVFAIKLGQ